MSEEDQQELQRYLDDINKEVDDENGDTTVLTIETQLVEEDENEEEEEEGGHGNGTIIVDAEGNYYFQTSDKMVKVKPIKNDKTIRKVAATVVTPKKKKNTAKPTTTSSVTNTKVEQVSPKKSNIKTELIVPNTKEEALDSEIDENYDGDDQVYEFDEEELDPDDPLENNEGVDYASKGLLKPIKVTKASSSSATAAAAAAAESFSCMLCTYETNKKFLLSRHLKSHSDDRPYKCSVCERGFKTNASLQNHVNTHTGNKPHICKECDRGFTTSGELVRHNRYIHTKIKPHKCTECDYCSVEMSKLRRHMRCHTGERPYQCPHCTYASPDTFKLKRHMRTHTGEKPYECDICHARFTQSNSLKYHRLIHSVNDKPVFQCHLCPTTCGRKTDLRLHIRKLHSGDQPIPCKRCGKELPDRYSYKMHVKTHEGEKCFRCQYCPYASITQRHLDSHMLIHTDEKPFICHVCKSTFRQKQLLSRHTKMYHTDNYNPPEPRKKDHNCPHCDKSFAFNGNLIRHMETHDPVSFVNLEKNILKMGRMKRVLPDGSVVISRKYKKDLMHSEDGEIIYEEADNKLEEEEMVEEEYDEYNEGDIQYVYEDFQEDEELAEEAEEQKKHVLVKAEDDDDEYLAVEVDDQGFMVIEIMPEDEEVVVDYEQPTEPQEIRSTQCNNKNIAKASVIKTFAENRTAVNTADCFGFEVVDDEEDHETKGAIELLNLIEQD